MDELQIMADIPVVIKHTCYTRGLITGNESLIFFFFFSPGIPYIQQASLSSSSSQPQNCKSFSVLLLLLQKVATQR